VARETINAAPTPVFLVSRLRPFNHGGQSRSQNDNVRHARNLCLRLARAGLAPFAGHAFYPEFLDDTRVEDREIGIACSHAFMRVCRAVIVYTACGYSTGMEGDMVEASFQGLPLFFWDGTDAKLDEIVAQINAVKTR
jgi:hypothetical protein